MNIISQRFSKASLAYDTLTHIQHTNATQLAVRFHLDCPQAQTILDVGTGTGRVVSLLRPKYDTSKIYGIDIARGMLNQAAQQDRKGCWLEADAELLPFLDDSFDGIVSSSSYQWVRDLPQAFREAVRCLRPQGRMMLAMFGENTFREMFDVFRQGKSEMLLQRLPAVSAVTEALSQSRLQNVHVDVVTEKVMFPDLWTLLRWIKNIGANGLNTHLFLGKTLLQQANEYYRSVYPLDEGIAVTFEVIWVTGEK